jgi:hypothetical protein
LNLLALLKRPEGKMLEFKRDRSSSDGAEPMEELRRY